MKTLLVNASDEEIKHVIRQWVKFLADEKYDAATEMIWPEILPGNGSVSEKESERWASQIIEALINNYGLIEVLEGETHKYRVVPVVLPNDDSMNADFEKKLQVERRNFNEAGQDYIGIVHVDLPLAYEEYDALSDLTARFYLHSINETEMVLLLFDIHVM